ncbi:MAG TPA: HPF/RaiA family ribosome-associated protein [Micromonosporaceae bacterium]|nr:HPF/RaiA family ribosome-associated protein [Micromonosporaceae bacterium]
MTRHRVPVMIDVECSVHGSLAASARSDAARMVRTLARYAHEPVLHARVRLTRSANPARERPVTAQVNLDVNGRLARAQVAARTVHEAIDLVRDRIRHRLDRLGRRWEARRGGVPHAEAHQWRHGQEPAHRPGCPPRPTR